MQDIKLKPRHTNSAHCRACRQPSLAELQGRQIARIMDAQREATQLYREKQECPHPANHRIITLLPIEEDSLGRVLDGARVMICRICLRTTEELM
jgi:hypothetical protein